MFSTISASSERIKELKNKIFKMHFTFDNQKGLVLDTFVYTLKKHICLLIAITGIAW